MIKEGCRLYSFMSIFFIFISSIFYSCGSAPNDLGTGETATIQLEYRNICGSYGCETYPIPANGSSSIHIKATLTDGSGEPVDVLTAVTFSTTLGSFPGGTTSYSAETLDDSGTVEVSLMAGITSGVAFITCSSNGVTQADYVTFTDGETAAITLEADPDSITADGSSSASITATLTDSTGDPVAAGTYVSFHTDSGTFANHTVIYTVQTPDENGEVTVSLMSSTSGDGANVCASSNGVSQCIFVAYTSEEDEEEEGEEEEEEGEEEEGEEEEA